jgi:uncharacterized protein DUF4785/uncharacterized protein DUF4784
MRTAFCIAAFLAASLAPSFAARAAQSLLSPTGNDQVPSRLVSLPAPVGQFEHAPVSVSWALDPHAALSEPPAYIAESREYWQTVDGAELQRGVPLRTTAPGAVIRISPARGSAPIHATEVAVNGNGKAARLEQAVSAAALQAAGMDVDSGSAVVKLAPENGAGMYSLHAANASGRYVLHVFEPDSDVVLKAQADRQHVLGGETISVSMDFSRSGRSVEAQAEALLVAPDGSSRPVPITRDRSGTLNARVKLPVQASRAPGLWELQLFANGGGISRDARTAFGVAAPTARLGGEVTVHATQLRMDVPVETGSPGRYEVRGTLYATAVDGSLAPISEAHSAAWFERGLGTLALAFDRSQVPAGYGAPYEVRQLELNDQSRLAPLETRGRAIRF